MDQQPNTWSSRLSFIITTAAFAVGLGNIWRFPYITGEGGGGACLFVYLGLIFLIGIPIMTIEIGLGRMSSATPLTGFGKLSQHKMWNGIGWLGVIALLLIKCYYVMILAWVLIYFWECLSGNISQLVGGDFSAHFDQMTANLWKVFAVIVGIMAMGFAIIRRGLQSGLEQVAKWMLGILFFLMIGLTLWAATLEEAMTGYRWFLTPDFSKINLDVFLIALGQIFFSVGVGMCVAFVFGSYTKKEDNLISSTAIVVFTDTFIAILAGFMLFPVIFSFGLSPNSGPDLVFVTMASVFSQLDYGQWLGAVFFLLLFLAGFTSLLASMQALTESFKEKFNWSLLRSLTVISLFLTVAALPNVFSYTENPFRLFGKTTFEFLDFLTNSVMLPLSGLLIVLFGGHVVGFDKLKAHLEIGTNTTIGSFWRFVVVVVIPLAILIILFQGIL